VECLLVPGTERVQHQVQVGVDDDAIELRLGEEPVPFPDAETIVEDDGHEIGPCPYPPVGLGIEMLEKARGDRFGAREYQPGDQLKVDLDLMEQAHFSVIRVGESAAGVWFDEYSNLSDDVPISSVAGSSFKVPAGAAGTRWFEALQPDGAEVLAGYRHPHFGRWAAVTTKQYEFGRITYVGTLPNQTFARAFFEWLGAPTGQATWSGLPESVTASSGVGRAGRRVHFVHNWSWTPAEATAPCALRDALADESFRQGDPVSLGAWDVRVMFEPIQESGTE
jgi:Beta-galactosidase trimerisation domain